MAREAGCSQGGDLLGWGARILGGEGAGPGTITGRASWQPVPPALQDK